MCGNEYPAALTFCRNIAAVADSVDQMTVVERNIDRNIAIIQLVSRDVSAIRATLQITRRCAANVGAGSVTTVSRCSTARLIAMLA